MEEQVMTPELYAELCLQMADSGDSMTKICIMKQIPWRRFWKFRESSDENRQLFNASQQDRFEKMFDRISELEQEMLGAIKSCDPKRANATANAYKVKMDNVRWALSKLSPAKFGDKMDVTSAGKQLKAIPPVLNVKIAKD